MTNDKYNLESVFITFDFPNNLEISSPSVLAPPLLTVKRRRWMIDSQAPPPSAQSKALRSFERFLERPRSRQDV